jgi:hypothetical protein
MEQAVKAYRANVGDYELTVRPAGIQWSISIRERRTGDWIEPIHDFADTIEEAQLRACRRASRFANLHIEQSASGDPCVAMLQYWEQIELPPD